MSATELAELAAESLGWDWPEHPSGPDAIRPEVEAILDRLIEKGWRPPATPSTEMAALEAIDPDRITYAQAGRLAQLQREARAAEPLCTARLSTGPDAWLLCILHEGHLTDHRSGDVTWMGAW